MTGLTSTQCDRYQQRRTEIGLRYTEARVRMKKKARILYQRCLSLLLIVAVCGAVTSCAGHAEQKTKPLAEKEAEILDEKQLVQEYLKLKLDYSDIEQLTLSDDDIERIEWMAHYLYDAKPFLFIEQADSYTFFCPAALYSNYDDESDDQEAMDIGGKTVWFNVEPYDVIANHLRKVWGADIPQAFLSRSGWVSSDTYYDMDRNEFFIVGGEPESPWYRVMVYTYLGNDEYYVQLGAEDGNGEMCSYDLLRLIVRREPEAKWGFITESILYLADSFGNIINETEYRRFTQIAVR